MISRKAGDVVYCGCGTVWISGGEEKALRGGVLEFLEELSVYKD